MEKLNIIKVLKYFAKKSWIIILIALLSFGIGYAYYYSEEKKSTYKSEASVLVNISTQNIELANSEMSIYLEIVKSKPILEKVIQELNLDLKYNDLERKIATSNTGNLKIINITVSDTSKERAVKIVNSVAMQFYERIDELFEKNIVTILDEADTAVKTKKLTVQNLSTITIIGVIIGLSVVFVFYYFDNKIKDEELIELNLEMPVLGRIHKNKKKQDIDIEVIKINIKHAIKQNKTILLTSTESEKCEALIGESIARAMAKEEEKILFIDWSNRSSKDSKEEILIKETDTKNLYLCNISNVESENDIKELINKLEKEYDRIIIMGTPIIGYSDSLMLSSLVDSTIIIVKMGYTKLNKLEEALKSLKLVQANVSGIIVNNV